MKRFEDAVLIHLDAAYNLARWITRDAAGAEDAVQDACLRAFRFFDMQHGPSTRAWFMAVVRNAALDWLQARRLDDEPYDDELHVDASAAESRRPRPSAPARPLSSGAASRPCRASTAR